MESLYIIIPVILIIVAIVVAAFIWAVNRNQFDDLESPAQDIIFDDRQTQHEQHLNAPAINKTDTLDD
ncbi:MAG TPA: cbb3-type cytochrome oxidase assembly protein CcoS [Pseudomonadales bacterium]|nr:cbb3-type cytochrome oxidase assembly protein CcoS [Pseudomonadales bacterium]